MSASAEARSPWLRSPFWDSFWMLSGLWLLLPVALFTAAPGALNAALIVATMLLWISHRLATTYTAFCVPAYRDLVRQQRLRFIVLPVAICLLVFAFVYAPRAVVPLDTWGKIQALGTIFFLYNTYHFGVQHYGVLSIYRMRAGQKSTDWLKGYERFLCLAVGGALVALAQVGHGAEVVHDSLVYGALPREAIGAAFSGLRLAAPAVILVLAAVYYAGELRGQARSLPKMLYVAGLALQGILAYLLSPLAFLFLWGVQHWLVSVALAAHMAGNDPSPVLSSSRWYAFWGRVNRQFWPTVLALGLVSMMLTPLLEYGVHREKIATGPAVAAFLDPFLRVEGIALFFVALSFASVYVHFVMDRAIFRFSDPAVRKVTVPLLFGRRA
jgi:hypothetical protein